MHKLETMVKLVSVGNDEDGCDESDIVDIADHDDAVKKSATAVEELDNDEEPTSPHPPKRIKLITADNCSHIGGKGNGGSSKCGANKVGATPPSWATTKFDVESWWPLLHERRVDELAAQSLYMLAQHSGQWRK